MSTKRLSHRGVVHLGLDVSTDSIAVRVLRPEERVADVEKISHDEESVRRLVARVGSPGRLWACCEAARPDMAVPAAGAFGGALRCDRPPLVPRAPGNKIKTDRRNDLIARSGGR